MTPLRYFALQDSFGSSGPTCCGPFAFRIHVGPMAFADEVIVENQHFVGESVALISVVDDHRPDPHINGLHIEMQVGQTIKAYGPILAQQVLTANDTAAFGQPFHGEWGGESDVFVEEGEDRIEIPSIPRGSPPCTKIDRDRHGIRRC